MRPLLSTLITLLVAATWPTTTLADPPPDMTYQGQLLDADRAPVPCLP